METSCKDIVTYWSANQDEVGLSVDWAEADKLCWRCAEERSLQRCHIVPRSLGGIDAPQNYVLLCGQCHAEAPNVDDPSFMWHWLRRHATDYYGTYWFYRGTREYEFLFGAKPFAGTTNPESVLPRVREAVQNHMAKTGTHWGQGKLNPATTAWVIRQVEEGLRNDA